MNSYSKTHFESDSTLFESLFLKLEEEFFSIFRTLVSAFFEGWCGNLGFVWLIIAFYSCLVKNQIVTIMWIATSLEIVGVGWGEPGIMALFFRSE